MILVSVSLLFPDMLHQNSLFLSWIEYSSSKSIFFYLFNLLDFHCGGDKMFYATRTLLSNTISMLGLHRFTTGLWWLQVQS